MKLIKEIKMFLLFFGLFVPFLLILGFLISGKTPSESYPKLFPQISDEELKQTKENCEKLMLPASFTKIKGSQIVKPEIALFYTEYISVSSSETVREYFVKMMVPQGWEYSPGDLSNGIIFYKDKYSISVEFSESISGSEKKYIVGCAWKSTRHGIIGDLFDK